jgi:hypothetical protein
MLLNYSPMVERHSVYICVLGKSDFSSESSFVQDVSTTIKAPNKDKFSFEKVLIKISYKLNAI